MASETRRRHARHELPMEVSFLTHDAYIEEYTANISYGGLFVATTERLPPQTRVLLKITIPDLASGYQVDAEVVYLLDDAHPKGPGMGMQFIDPSGDVTAALKRFFHALQQDDKPANDPVAPVHRIDDPPIDAQTVMTDRHDEISLRHQLEKMALTEKLRIALTGGRDARNLLMQDHNPMIHQYVLRNPRISTDEVTKIAENPKIAQELLICISKNTNWMKNSSIRYALTKNPKTPLPIANQLISRLTIEQLTRLAKSDAVRGTIAKAAKRTLAQRGVII